MSARSSLVCLTNPLQASINSDRSLTILESNRLPIEHSRAKNRDKGELLTGGVSRVVGSTFSQASAFDLRLVIHAGRAVSDVVDISVSSSSSSVVRIFRSLPTAVSPDRQHI